MSYGPPNGPWHQQVYRVLGLVFVTSFVVHMAAGWLAPVLPVIVTLAVVGVIGWLVLRR